MQEGNSGEFWHAYYAYQKSGLLPSAFSALPRREKAMLIHFHNIEQEQAKKQERLNKSRSQANKRGRS